MRTQSHAGNYVAPSPGEGIEPGEIRAFVEALNGGPVTANGKKNPVFDLPVRVESVGFDGDGNVESIAIRGPLRC